LDVFTLAADELGDPASQFSIVLTTETGTTNNLNFSGGESGGYTYYFKVTWSPKSGVSTDANSQVEVQCPVN
jgi:hypothetical protein